MIFSDWLGSPSQAASMWKRTQIQMVRQKSNLGRRKILKEGLYTKLASAPQSKDIQPVKRKTHITSINVRFATDKRRKRETSTEPSNRTIGDETPLRTQMQKKRERKREGARE